MAGCRCSPSARAAALMSSTMGSKSGPKGVPTLTMTKSLSAMAAKSVVARSRPRRTLSATSSARPGSATAGPALVDLVDDALADVDSCHGPAAVREDRPDHGTDVAEANHRDPDRMPRTRRSISASLRPNQPLAIPESSPSVPPPICNASAFRGLPDRAVGYGGACVRP